MENSATHISHCHGDEHMHEPQSDGRLVQSFLRFRSGVGMRFTFCHSRLSCTRLQTQATEIHSLYVYNFDAHVA